MAAARSVSETQYDETMPEVDESLDKLVGEKPRVPDGGWGWWCVLGRFYIHFLIIGTKSAFGIIYIELIDYFHGNRAETAWVGSVASGIILLIAPLSGWMTERYGCRLPTIVGSSVATVGLFASWFSTSMTSLCVTYGVITGLGLGLTFIPSAVIVLHYFDKRRGFASAIGSTGGGIGAMVLPLFYVHTFEEYGWRGSLWILAGLVLNGVVCGALFRPPLWLKTPELKEQCEKESESETKTVQKSSQAKEFFSVLKNIRFVLFALGTFFCNVGYATPLVHLPDMASQRGFSKSNVAVLLSIMGISGVILRLPVAWVSDFRSVSRLLIHTLSLLVCGVATVICPFVYSYWGLALYSAVHGGFIGVYGSFLSVLVADIVGVRDSNKAFAFLVFFGGLPSLFSSPLAGWMYDGTQSYITSFCFAGSTFLVSSLLTLVVFLIGFFNKH
ncbi:monocarboxylate transporter 12-like [Haliotis rubra]|uniref:monocarboxylate transporter 12-like n=1 Tax=Haliotis rubra TaxID=36100 RepID=UPI001EE5FB85|nr:monocarboxylate transporter 12-like [Haliotis rubra]